MKKYLPLLACVFLSACYPKPSFEEVRVMKEACKAQGGEVETLMRFDSENRVAYIRCIVEGARYDVSTDGKLL